MNPLDTPAAGLGGMGGLGGWDGTTTRDHRARLARAVGTATNGSSGQWCFG